MEFIHYTKNDIKGNRFYRVPKEFVENDTYRKKLNSNAKLLYSILRDRYELSIKNNWIDKEGHVYCYYTRDKLAHDLGIGVRTVDSGLDSLKELNLLKEDHYNGKAKKYYIGIPTPAKTAQVEEEPLQKLHPIETESFSLKETELFKKIYIISNENDVFAYYSQTFKKFFGKEHPTMNEDKISELRLMYSEFSTDFDIGEEEWFSLVNYHFEHLPEKNNGNILAFLAPNGGSGCLFRYMEELNAEEDNDEEDEFNRIFGI